MTDSSPQVVEAFWQIACLDPAAAHPDHVSIFTDGLTDVQMSPSPGFVCPSYRSGGVLFVAKNGAVGDTSINNEHDRRAAELWRELARAEPSGREASYHELMGFLSQACRDWRIYNNLILPLTKRLGIEREFAFINLIGFRSKVKFDSKLKHVFPEAWRSYSGELVRTLEPTLIVPLGREQETWLPKLYDGPARVSPVMRRHNGDRAIPRTFDEDVGLIAEAWREAQRR